jgi:hypothetical protein
MGVWKFSVFRPERKNADREFIPHKGGDRKRYKFLSRFSAEVRLSCTT